LGEQTVSASIEVVDKYIIVDDGDSQVFLENIFNPKIVSASENSGSDSSSWLDPQTLQRFMWPTAIIVVLIYQFYLKTPTTKSSPARDILNKKPKSKEEATRMFEERFSNLTNDMSKNR
jgi:hypothetical protein